MANPVYDVIASGLSGSNSFTTSLHMLNYSQAGIQVVWSGLDSTTPSVRLRGSNDNSNFQDLTTDPVSMVVSASNHIFNVYQVAYSFLQIFYNNNSATTGSISVHAVRKNY